MTRHYERDPGRSAPLTASGRAPGRWLPPESEAGILLMLATVQTGLMGRGRAAAVQIDADRRGTLVGVFAPHGLGDAPVRWRRQSSQPHLRGLPGLGGGVA